MGVDWCMIGFVRIQTNVSRCKEGVTCDAGGTLTFPLSGRCDVIVVGLRFGQQRQSWCFGEWLWPLSGNTGICAVFTSSCVTQNSFTTITRSIFASPSATRHHVLPYHFWHGGFFSDMFLSWFFLVLEVNYFIGDLFLTVSSCTKSDDSMYHKTWCKLFIWGLAYQHNKNNNTFALSTQVETEARLCRGLTNPKHTL